MNPIERRNMEPIFVSIKEEDIPKSLNKKERYKICYTRNGTDWVSTAMLSEDDLRTFRNTIRQFLRELKHRRNKK